MRPVHNTLLMVVFVTLLPQGAAAQSYTDRRDYQKSSVQTVQGRARGAATWVREKLGAIHVTPARLALVLGLLGFLWTWNKNKKKVQWAVIFGFSLLLSGLGGAAIYFQWPAFN